jgi:hypothetical protein
MGGFICIALTSLAASACTFILPFQAEKAITSERTCAPLRPFAFNLIDHSDEQDSDSTSVPLSEQAIQVAKVIGAFPILADLSALKQAGETHGIRFIELRQLLSDRLLLTLFEVSSSVAEIVCERDRADQIADQMDAIDAALVKRLTLLSIVVGGVASVVSGAVGLAGGAMTAGDGSEIAGGVLASVFGGSALFATSKREFLHERNLLKEVWDNPRQSTMFSPAIWRFLQRHHKDQHLNAHSEVVQAWRQQGRLGDPGSPDEQERITLIFGQGGIYSARDLRARVSMLETLEAHIHLMSEELELFLREIIQTNGEDKSKEGGGRS